MSIKDKSKGIELKLKEYGKMNNEEILKKFKTSYEGLSCVEIEEKQDEYGKNILDFKNNNTVFNRLKEAFINPFNIVLILVAIITFFTDVIIATNKDYLTFILIVSTVFISAMISFFQQTNISQTLIIHLMRTPNIPFITSKPSKQLVISTLLITILTLIISFTDISVMFDLIKLPPQYGIAILGLMVIYAIIIQIYKKIYLKKI